jgi:hypothetical protein
MNYPGVWFSHFLKLFIKVHDIGGVCSSFLDFLVVSLDLLLQSQSLPFFLVKVKLLHSTLLKMWNKRLVQIATVQWRGLLLSFTVLHINQSELLLQLPGALIM